MTKENKALAVRWLNELWSEGDYDVADEIFASDYVRHDASTPVSGPDGYKNFIMMFRAAFPDLKFTCEDMVAEDDKVLVRWTARGTHQGELHGIAPTGRVGEINGMDLLRIVGGRIVESWPCFDALGLLRQLGAIPE